MPQQRKFVIHKHTRGNDIHWDLMVEWGEVLKTWRLDNPPEILATEKTKATPIQDHDKKFLTYQGPVNNDTGTAEIVDEGMCSVDEEITEIIFKGKKVKGVYKFTKNNEDIFIERTIRNSNKIVTWIGKAALILSSALIIFISYCYLNQPDNFAAITFFPAWVWGLFGIILSFFILLANKRLCILLILCWIMFTAIAAEEPKSLVRGIFKSKEDWNSIPAESKLRVISLNCAAGNIDAMYEIISYHPDIVLLQETPAKKELLEKFANALFGNEAAIVYDVDTAIIVKGQLERREFSKPKSLFVTQAHAKLNSGFELEIFSLRLKPPVININLLSPYCWKNHKDGRIARQEQIEFITEQLRGISNPVILGGDFNVGANDGSLYELRKFLTDTFNIGGIGWGHTALNSVPFFRVDQIWTSSEIKPFAVYARKTLNSDHRMVICDLVIK